MNNYSEINEKINCCEAKYISCFTEYYENDQIIRYRDNQLNDMYDHNFTYIKSTSICKESLQQLIKNEMDLNHQENKYFCKITMDEMIDEKCMEGFFKKPEVEHCGKYVYIPMKSPGWNSINGCQIRKITDSSMVEDLISLDIIQNSETSGEDFCNRRAKRRGEVYLSEMPLESYICYYNGIPVGNCDLLLYNGTAKIEDFVVLPEYQRRGIGTTILKYLIDTAISSRVDTIYLVADEDDWPKKMYVKMGFEKVCDSYAFFWKSI